MTTSRDTEQQDFKKFISNTQSTHNPVVTNSVAIALLQLRSIYLGSTPDTNHLDTEYKTCVSELLTLSKASPARLAAAEYIISTSKEPFHQQFDIVKITTSIHNLDSKEPTLTTTAYLFELKEVLTLVWKAINDDKRYTHHYTGTPAEKLAAAIKDKDFRLESFFNCLKSIKNEKVCHHGNRNELVFLLNGKYENINIIEDGLSTVRAILKDELHKKFWAKYTDEKLPAHEKKALLCHVYKWMNEGDATTIFSALEEKEQATTKQINTLFLANGTDPKFINLDTTIKNAVSNLAFSCHPNESKDLHRINSIFNYVDEKNLPERNKALATFKQWLLEKSDLSLASDLQKINIFYFYFEAHPILSKAVPLFAMTGHSAAEFIELQKTIATFFTNHQDNVNFTPLTPAIITSVQHMQETYKKVKASNMSDQIESFFATWNAALDEYTQNNANSKQIKTIYSLLLSDLFKEKVQLKDKEIEAYFTESKTYHDEIEVTPYLVNRFLLHAILTPEQWSEKFSYGLQRILTFIQSNFNQAGMHVTQALSRDSYNRRLLLRIKTLINTYAPDAKTDVKHEQPPSPRLYDPQSPPIIPEDCKKYHDWSFMLPLLNKPTRERIYGFSANAIHKTLIKGTEIHRYDYLQPLSKIIPASHRLGYLIELYHQNKLHSAISGFNKLPFSLIRVPSHSRLGVLAMLTNAHLKDMLELKHGHNLPTVIALLPAAEKLTFLTKAIHEILSPIKMSEIVSNWRDILSNDQFIAMLKEIIYQPSIAQDEKNSGMDTNPTLMTKITEALTLLEKLPIQGQLPNEGHVQAARLQLCNSLKAPHNFSQVKDWPTLRTLLYYFDEKNQISILENIGTQNLSKLPGSILQKNLNFNEREHLYEMYQELKETANLIQPLFLTNNLIHGIKNGKFITFNQVVNSLSFMSKFLVNLTKETVLPLIKDTEDLYDIMTYINVPARFGYVKDFLAHFDNKNFTEKTDKNFKYLLITLDEYMSHQERTDILSSLIKNTLSADSLEKFIIFAHSFTPSAKYKSLDEKDHPILDQKNTDSKVTAIDWIIPCLSFQNLHGKIQSWQQLINILKHLPLDFINKHIQQLPKDYLLKQMESFENLVITLEILDTKNREVLLNKLYKLDPKIRFDALNAINRPIQDQTMGLQKNLNDLDRKNDIALDAKTPFVDKFPANKNDLYIVLTTISDGYRMESWNYEELVKKFQNPYAENNAKIFLTYEAAQYYSDRMPNQAVIIKINQPFFITENNTIFIEKPLFVHSVKQWHKYPEGDAISLDSRIQTLNNNFESTHEEYILRTQLENRTKLIRDGKNQFSKIINQMLEIIDAHLTYLAGRATTEYENCIGYKLSEYGSDLADNKYLKLINNPRNSKKLDILILRHALLSTLKSLLNDQVLTEFVRLEKLSQALHQPVNDFYHNHAIRPYINNNDNVATVLKSTGNIGIFRISNGKQFMLKIEKQLEQFKQILTAAGVKYEDKNYGLQYDTTFKRIINKKK